ncbi:MAG: hypothetical protein ACR2H3_15605 [Acidimicrobiales bacterium]
MVNQKAKLVEIVAADGRALLLLTRPAKVFKSTIVVARPDGSEVGRIVQENMVGKIRFGLMQGDQRVGSINAENWRAWNFNIRDSSEQEVARITPPSSRTPRASTSRPR